MAFSLSLLEKLSGGSALVENSNTFSGTLLQELNEDVNTGETDKQLTIALDVSTIKAIIITSNQAVTFETNSGAVPDETLNLVANVPYVWTNTCYFANLLATDWTAVFITNSSGSTATIKILVLSDSTP